MAEENVLGRTGGWLREQAVKLQQLPGVGDAAERVKGLASGVSEGLRTAGPTPSTEVMGPPKPPRGNTGLNPNIPPGGMSPEARALQAPQVQPAPVQPTQVKPPSAGYNTGLSMGKAANTAMSVAKRAAPITELFDENVQSAVNPDSDMSVTDRLKTAGRSVLRVGGGALGAAAGGALGSLAGPVGTLAGGAAGGVGGYELGNKAANALFGEQKATPLTSSVSPVAAAPSPALRSAPVQSGTIGAPQTQPQAGQIPIAKDSMPAGTGSVTRSDGLRTAVNTRLPSGMERLPENATQEQAAEWLKKMNVVKQLEARDNAAMAGGSGGGRGTDISALRDMATKNGAFGAMAGLQGYGAISRMEKGATDVGLRNQANQTALAKATYDASKDQRDFTLKMAEVQNKADLDNRSVVDSEIKEVATRMAGPAPTKTMGGVDKDAHAANLQKAEVELKGDIKYTLADTGKKYERLAPAERQQLFQAAEFRSKVMDARGGIKQSMVDYFGNKRFDSKNLYSWLPARDKSGTVQPATALPDGTLQVKLGNGNTVSVGAVAGGGFKVLGPNEAINADMMALVQPAIDAYRKKAKG
jgi:hypothetical protein